MIQLIVRADDGNPIGDFLGSAWDNAQKAAKGVGDVLTAPGTIGGVAKSAAEGAAKAADTAQNVYNFGSDPLGAIFRATRDGAVGLAKDILPALVKATEPDLSQDWFLKAYAVSFAAAIILWGFIQIANMVAVSRGHVAGEEFLEALTTRTGLFFGGAAFGPLIGITLVKVFGSLSESLIAWGIGTSAQTMLDTLVKLMQTDPGAVPGGVIVGILLMAAMIVGLVIVLLMLVVMLVTLYFSGVLIPMGIAWFTYIADRSGRFVQLAKRLPAVWIGILASHPLLFFMLGVAYTMVAESAAWMKWQGGMQTLVQLLVSFCAMALAGLAPFAVFSFAPVLPNSAGQQGASVNAPGRKEHGPGDLKDVKNLNRGRQGDQSDSSTSGEEPSQTSSSPGGPMEQQTDGSLMRKLKDLRSAQPSGPAGKGQGAGGGPASAAEGAGGAAEGAAGGVEGAAAGAEAAGAAESSTGVGAAIGVPTMIAGAGLAAAAKAAQFSVETAKFAARMSESGGKHAANAMDDEG
ncbi:hypothetical protein SPF06_19720 [Sinomonas sp. JGH33]|uniref:Conjugal transfer protein TrbL n=1 Tax=Sinomonas terricola TaxID=3110330 RepID=A0ABU5TBP7_9MICC|nr:hypothetical protein [Sinomonas sp. JGH33]MEA5456957.1 hypothetical protein [Sinomonas sp. JGH33]